MSVGAAILALTAVQAVSQIGQGYVQKSESDYNATLLEGQAGLIGVQKDITDVQYMKLKGQALSKSMSTIGASGIKPTGSAISVMLDTQKQIGLDQIYTKLNYENDIRYKKQEADTQRRAGKYAVRSGWTNAFSTILEGGVNYAMYKGGGTSSYKASKTTMDVGFGKTPYAWKPSYTNADLAKFAGRT